MSVSYRVTFGQGILVKKDDLNAWMDREGLDAGSFEEVDALLSGTSLSYDLSYNAYVENGDGDCLIGPSHLLESIDPYDAPHATSLPALEWTPENYADLRQAMLKIYGELRDWDIRVWSVASVG